MFLIRQPVPPAIAGQIQNYAIAGVLFGPQAAAHHLQVEGQAQSGPGKHHASGVRQVKSFGSHRHIYQYPDTAIPKLI